MDSQSDKSKLGHDDYAQRLAIKSSLSWYGWGSPIGLSLFLVGVGILIWFLHLANIIH